jgi:2-dehydro-3-deoxyphosphogluconate aldolase/(4S)-4-hydroxy-2-oxoglutarate aldolase
MISMKNILDIMYVSAVIPVIEIDDPEHAVPLARALVAGGIRVLEVTLRTAHGLSAIRAISEAVPALRRKTQPNFSRLKMWRAWEVPG